MDKKQAENYVFISLFVIPVLIFISTPAHPEGNITLQLDDFIDRYLFRNGWYSPSNYPFAAKVTNSLSVVWAIATGSFMGIWRRNDIIPSLFPKNIGWILLTMAGLGVYMILKSYYPQEFKISRIRGGIVFTESFHNNPILFLAMIIVKEVCIYLPFRMIALVIYFFKGKK